jgi:hypothetical protein
MTLMDLLFATAIGAILLAVAGTMTVFAARSVLAMTNYTELDRHSRNALDSITRDVRQAASLDSYSTNQIVLRNLDGSTCTFIYSQGQGTLTRIKDGVSTVLLENCDRLAFNVSQRNPSNDFTFFAASSLSTAKLIDVNWKCSREIRGQKVNTESIQTAKIVMRN